MATFTGTNANETITPASVSSTVEAVPAGSRPSAADDVIDGGGGTDTIDGGGGADRIWFSGTGSTARGGSGDDMVGFDVPGTSGTASGTAYGGAGTDVLYFSVPGIEPATYSGAITLRGGDGSDTLSGFAGFVDKTTFKDVDVHLYGDAGNDRLEATALGTYSAYVPHEGAENDDYLRGGTGDDTYVVQEQQDAVIERPGEGYDTVEVNNSSTSAYTVGPNVEKMLFSYLEWGGSLTGNASANEIIGTFRNNELFGAGGNDTIYGKPSNDTYVADDHDTIHGGSGDDLIYGSGGDADTWDGNDSLYGDAGDDRIFAHIGDDKLYGGTGNDELHGQAGNDMLCGGAGLDRLSGEGGNDVFDYNATTDSTPSARDVITDFAGIGAGIADRIDLSTIDANAGIDGNQRFSFVGTEVFTAAGQLRVTPSGTDTLIQANTGGDLAPDLEIAVTDGAALPSQWAGTDFVL